MTAVTLAFLKAFKEALDERPHWELLTPNFKAQEDDIKVRCSVHDKVFICKPLNLRWRTTNCPMCRSETLSKKLTGKSKSDWRTFEDARNWAISMQFKSGRDFKRFKKTPRDIPRNPNLTYKDDGWISWSHFLGIPEPTRKKNKNGWVSFKEARQWVRSQNIQSETDWRKFRKTRGMRNDIPTNPNREYAEQGWISWADFLGTENVKYSEITRRSYREAQKWAVSRGISTQNEWLEAVKHKDFPVDIYKSPDRGYSEFSSWGDFLKSNSRMSIKNQEWRPFQEVKKWAHNFPVLSKTHWVFLAKMDKIPRDIPTNPNQVYSEFTTWRDFLNFSVHGKSSKVETVLFLELSNFLSLEQQILINDGFRQKWVDLIERRSRTVIEFDGSYWHNKVENNDVETTAWLQGLGWRVIRIRQEPLDRITSEDLLVPKKISEIEVCKMVVRHLLDLDIDMDETAKSLANKYIENNDFLSLKDDLLKPVWLPYEDAQKIVVAMKLSSQTEWRQIRHKLPKNIPRTPESVYINSWKGWGDWLGTGNPSPNKNFLSYNDAVRLVRSHKVKNSREYVTFRENNPSFKLPRNPSSYYGSKGWVSWKEFTGLARKSRKTN